MSRVAITGLGIVSAAGHGLAATRLALREGRSGLGPLSLFASPRCGHLPVAEVRELTADAAGDAPELREARRAGAEVPEVLRRAAALSEARTVHLGSLALGEALADARLPTSLGPERRAITVGCTVGGMPESERAVARALELGLPRGALSAAGADGDRDDPWQRHEAGYTTSALARAANLRGPALTLSSACASGAQALASGAELLAAGLADAVLAGGVDALCRLTLNGFASLLAVDPAGCRPFDRDRAGMSLGEGAAFLVLEREESARARGATPLAFLRGWGSSCDAFHATAPEPEGRGAEEAMRAALTLGGREPGDVSYVNAHGTGTRDNDRAEGRALRRLFGEALPPVSSTKRVFGHTLGAAGAIEAVASVLALREGFLPGNPGFQTPDPEVGIDPVVASRPSDLRLVLSNSFGFGGANTALLFEAAP